MLDPDPAAALPPGTPNVTQLRDDGRETGHALARLVLGDLAGLFDRESRLGGLVLRLHTPFDAFELASDAVARGNRKVFAEIGTEASTGPKLFCLSGNIEQPGTYAVPFGTTLGELIELAGGVSDGRALKAVLLGGAAGVFVGPESLELPLTFEATRAAGATASTRLRAA